MQLSEHPVTGARLCVLRNGVVRKLARLAWSNTDASLYIAIYRSAGRCAYFGRTTVPAAGSKWDFNFTEGSIATSGNPKLSLHDSGQAHVAVGSARSKAIFGKRLGDGEGGHVATVQTFDTEGLPALGREPSTGRVPDLIATADEEDWWTAPRWLVLAFSDAESARKYPLRITMRRKLRPDLHVALKPHAHAAPEATEHGGSLVIGGWPADQPPGLPMPILYAVTTRGDSLPGDALRSAADI